MLRYPCIFRRTNQNITKFLDDKGFSGDYNKLVAYYWFRVFKTLRQHPTTKQRDVIFWADVIEQLPMAKVNI